MKAERSEVFMRRERPAPERAASQGRFILRREATKGKRPFQAERSEVFMRREQAARARLATQDRKEVDI